MLKIYQFHLQKEKVNISHVRKSYICANSAFTWFLKVHQIKFSERQTSLGSFCLILECRQIYSRQNCRTQVTSSGILQCNISELETPTVPPVKSSEHLSQKQSCPKWSFRPVGGGGFRPTAEERQLANRALCTVQVALCTLPHFVPAHSWWNVPF